MTGSNMYTRTQTCSNGENFSDMLTFSMFRIMAILNAMCNNGEVSIQYRVEGKSILCTVSFPTVVPTLC